MTAAPAPRVLSRRRLALPGQRAAHRARKAVAGPLWQTAAERGVGRVLRDPAVRALAAGARDKAVLLVSEHDAPVAIVRLIADRWQTEWLTAEAELLAALRRCATGPPRLAEAVPAAPLFSGAVRGERVVVEAYDPVLEHLGEGTAAEHRDLLASLQAQTRRPARTWTAEDARAVLFHSLGLTDHLPPGVAGPGLLGLAQTELDAAVGAGFSPVAAHGDFRPARLAASPASLRAFGWEWAAAAAHPAADRWSYELDGVRAAAADGARDLPERVAASLATVAAGLEIQGDDARFARALLVPAALEHFARAREGAADAWPAVLGAIERVLRDRPALAARAAA